MRINSYQVSQIYGNNTTKKTNKSTNAASKGTTDVVSFSTVGTDLLTAKTALKGTSDVREDLIAPLKKSIDDGTYDVSADSFAEKLLSAYENRGY